MGQQLRLERVPDINVGPEQELFPDDTSKRRVEAFSEKQRLAFFRIVETMLDKKSLQSVSGWQEVNW